MFKSQQYDQIIFDFCNTLSSNHIENYFHRDMDEPLIELTKWGVFFHPVIDQINKNIKANMPRVLWLSSKKENEMSLDPNNVTIELKFDLRTVNVILSALDELPHKVSRPIVDSIQMQARPQLAALQAPPEEQPNQQNPA